MADIPSPEVDTLKMSFKNLIQDGENATYGLIGLISGSHLKISGVRTEVSLLINQKLYEGESIKYLRSSESEIFFTLLVTCKSLVVTPDGSLVAPVHLTVFNYDIDEEVGYPSDECLYKIVSGECFDTEIFE